MSRKTNNSVQTNLMHNYFHAARKVSEVQAAEIEQPNNPSKKQKPNDYYSECLHQQHEVSLQDSHCPAIVDDEPNEITIIEVEDVDETEEKGLEDQNDNCDHAEDKCRNVECINEVRLF